MGPRPRSRGIKASGIGTAQDIQRQWGRDRAVAEFHAQLVHETARAKLQWGRDRAVAELPPRTPRTC